ncbi:hypothetical protein BZA77DRAFT_357000 [Pyronema omphalodes]|nr:hypothetical protein BZA77DRAFT_357000 [Pyronema omphalodes]
MTSVIPSISFPTLARKISSTGKRSSRFLGLGQLRTNSSPKTSEDPTVLAETADGIIRLTPPESDSTFDPSPQSCVTDAFNEETNWSNFKDNISISSNYDEEPKIHVEDEDEWMTYQSESCTGTETTVVTASTYEDCVTRDSDTYSECESTATETQWDGTVIDDCSTLPELVVPQNDHSNEDYGKEVIETIYIAQPMSCRIESVSSLDEYPENIPVTPEFPPTPEPEEVDLDKDFVPRRPQRHTMLGVLRTGSFTSDDGYSGFRPPSFIQRYKADPGSMSRENMTQDWYENPATKLDMEKLGELTPPTPNSKRMSTPPAPRSPSPLAWLTTHVSKAVSTRPRPPPLNLHPAFANDHLRDSPEDQGKSPDLKRARSPRRWSKMWQ